MKVPFDFVDLLSDETAAMGMLATIQADGSPQVTPIWFDTDGDDLCVNTVEGRVKARNMQNRPMVAMLIVDPENPYRYLQIRGEARQNTEIDEVAHTHSLAQKYLDESTNPWYHGEPRLVFNIQVSAVSTMDG